MSEQHTPGPWEWWTSNSWRRLRHSDRGVSTNVLQPVVCRDGHPDIDVSEANMALIAAAPDMLAALKAAVELSDRMLAKKYPGGRTAENQTIYERCVAAIAKADPPALGKQEQT